jgi:hypothetical protein
MFFPARETGHFFRDFLDDRGHSQFNDLLRFMRGERCFVPFDLLPVTRMHGTNGCWIASMNLRRTIGDGLLLIILRGSHREFWSRSQNLSHAKSIYGVTAT